MKRAETMASKILALADQMDLVAGELGLLFDEQWASPTYSSTIWPLLHHSSELSGAAQMARNWAGKMAEIKFAECAHENGH